MNAMFGNLWTTSLGLLAGAITYAMKTTTAMPTTKADWWALGQGILLALLGIAAKDATTGSKPGS